MKRTLALILAVVMMMALAACGGDKPTSTPNNPTTSTPLQQGTGDINKDKDTPVTTDPAVKYKEHVEIACTGLPTTLDPYQKTNNVHDTTFKLSHNQLIYYNYETAEFEPELAAEWKTEAADTYWFKLKQGVKFHNGEELTSDDVLWTFVERPKTLDAIGAGTLVKIPSIDVGDFETKLKQVTKYLEKGDKIKVTIRFRGRQMAHTELGQDVLLRFADRLKDIAEIESNDGINFSTFVGIC